MNTALLLIDLQIGFFEGDTPVCRAEAVLGKVKSLINKARYGGLPIFYIQHDAKPETDGPIHPAIAPAEKDIVILKYTPDSFYETALRYELDRLRVQKLVIAGFQSELCINATCRRAVEMGYAVTLVEDAHSTYNPEAIQAITDSLKSHLSLCEAEKIKFIKTK